MSDAPSSLKSSIEKVLPWHIAVAYILLGIFLYALVENLLEYYLYPRIHSRLHEITLELSSIIITGYFTYRLMRRHRQALQRTETLSQTIIATANDVILILDTDYTIRACNAKASTVYGYSEEELLGKRIHVLRHPDHWESIERHFAAAHSPEGTLFETEHVRRDGARFPVEVSTRAFAVDGRVQYMLLVRDISERKRAEDVIRAERDFSAAVLDTVGAMIIVLDTNGRIVEFNRACEEITGYTYTEIAGQRFWDLFVPPEQRRRIIDVFESHDQADFPHQHETTLLTKSGEPRRVTWNNTVLTRDDGGISYLISTGIDVTEQKAAELALRAERDFSSTILDTVGALVVVLDVEGRIVRFNRACEAITGYSFAEVEGRRLEDTFLTSEDRDELFPHLHALHSGSFPTLYENVWVTKCGAQRLISWSNTVLMEGGEAKYLIATGIDVTEKRQAEAALCESRERYRSLYENAMVGLFRASITDGTLLEANGHFLEMHGYSSLDACAKTGQTSLQYANPADRAEVLALLERQGEVRNHEVLLHRRDGSPFWARISGRIFREAGYLEGCILDISAEREAQTALLAERERLAVTLRSIGDGVVTTDREGRIILMNRMAEEMTGWKQEEALGRPLLDVFRIINEDTRVPCDSPVTRVLGTGMVFGLANHTVLIARDGTERIIADSGAPIFDAQGEIIGVVLVFQDVTLERRAEEELRKADKLESLGILAGGLAHDFNNLLAAIIGNISLAKVYADPGEQLYHKLLDAELAAMQARDLTQQLLTFSKGGTPVKQVMQLTEVLHDAVHVSLTGSTTPCDIHLADDPWPILADRGQIGQVISNLIINANQAMPQGGVITVRVTNTDLGEEAGLPLEPGAYVKLTIADQGVGIPRESLCKIFDPFFTTKQRGNGLGLASVYSIIKHHGGGIFVDSEEGTGTTFTVYLPAEPPAINAPGTAGTEGRVLVMDDDELIREVLTDMLAALGYVSVAVPHGQAALAAYQSAKAAGHPFDLVFMDLTIHGGMSGKEAICHLREFDPHVLAIASSGYASDPIMAEYRRYGFTAAIAKPYQLAELNAILRRVLHESKHAAQEVTTR